MYNITLFFKTPNQEESFNFPNTTLTKEVVQRLICTLTNESIDTFHIYYYDQEYEITLSIQEDYENAIHTSFQLTGVSIFVTTQKDIKFLYMGDHEYRPKENRHVSTKEKKGRRNKSKNKKASDYSRTIYTKLKKINSFNEAKQLDSDEIQIEKDYFQRPKGIISEKPAMQNNLKQYRTDLNLGELIGELVKTSPILGIHGKANQKYQMKDDRIRPLSSDRSGKPPVENSLSIEQKTNLRYNEKIANQLNRMKEGIIHEVLSRLPLYLKQQCFKYQLPQLRQQDLSANARPICSNCRKTLNAKDKNKYKKQVVSRQIRQIYPEREQTKSSYSHTQFFCKK